MAGKVLYLGCDLEEQDELTSVISKIKADHSISADDELIIIGDASQHEEAMSVPQYFIHLFRESGLSDNERQTVLSSQENLIFLQLCLAELSKKETGDFDVATSEVLSIRHQLIEYKLGHTAGVSHNQDFERILNYHQSSLMSSNVIDLLDVFGKIKEEVVRNEELRTKLGKLNLVVLRSSKSTETKEMLTFLVGEKKQFLVKVESPLFDGDPAINKAFTIEYDTTVDDITFTHTFVTLQTPNRIKPSATEVFVENVLLSYLELLINSRNEIALARVLNVPERELDHVAFTSLKQSAKQRKMSMYQTASSTVMRLRLGGKSYALDPQCPLKQHIKGLSEFVDLMQKLQTIVEEDQNTSNALHRVLNVLKNMILKHNAFCRASVESVVERIKAQSQTALNFLEQKVTESPIRKVGTGGSMWGRKAVKVIQHILDRAAGLSSNVCHVDILDDVLSSQKSPLSFPSLLSMFRSPIEASPDSKVNKSLVERIKEKMPAKKSHGQKLPHPQSTLSWAMPEHHLNFNDHVNNEHNNEHVLRKPEVANKQKLVESLLDQENIDTVQSSISSVKLNQKSNEVNTNSASEDGRKIVSQKRSLTEAFSQQPAKKVKKLQPKKRGPVIPKGQRQLTSFFRM